MAGLVLDAEGRSEFEPLVLRAGVTRLTSPEDRVGRVRGPGSCGARLPERASGYRRVRWQGQRGPPAVGQLTRLGCPTLPTWRGTSLDMVDPCIPVVKAARRGGDANRCGVRTLFLDARHRARRASQRVSSQRTGPSRGDAAEIRHVLSGRAEIPPAAADGIVTERDLGYYLSLYTPVYRQRSVRDASVMRQLPASFAKATWDESSPI